MSKNCEDFQRYLKDDLAGELDASARKELDAHLGDCRLCQKELELLDSVRAALGSVEEAPVPHHFFVYQQTPPSIAQLFQQMSWTWKAGLTFACSTILMICALAIGEAQLNIERDSFTLSFGQAPVQMFDSEAFKEELVEVMNASSVEEDRRWVSQLRADWERSLETANNQQHQFTQAFLEGMETRLDERAQNRETALSEELSGVMVRLHRASLVQHETDLNSVYRRMNRFAANDRKVNAVMSSLVEIADRQSD